MLGNVYILRTLRIPAGLGRLGNPGSLHSLGSLGIIDGLGRLGRLGRVGRLGYSHSVLPMTYVHFLALSGIGAFSGVE